MRIVMLLAAEVEAASKSDALKKLDAFRESVRPGLEHGVVLYRIRRQDAASFEPEGFKVKPPSTGKGFRRHESGKEEVP